MGVAVFALLLASALPLISIEAAAITSDWKTGRATYYGTDGWSINSGSCNYGTLSPYDPLGWNVCAIADVMEEYQQPPGLCGTCFEVQCNPSVFSDNYGMVLDRRSACYYANTSIILRATDTCPCTYAGNAYSNKRWCCGDMNHMDVSYWAFTRLASDSWGVIGIRYRPVPCDYQPPSQAPALQYPSWAWQGAAGPKLRDWPEYEPNAPEPLILFDDYIADGWGAWTYNAWVPGPGQVQTTGMGGSTAVCAKISLNGALAFSTSNQGAFIDRTALSFWMYVGATGDHGEAAQVADIDISIGGPQGMCTPQRIYAVSPTQFAPMAPYRTDYYWLFKFHLGGFSGGDANAALKPGDFTGCGGNSVWELDRVEFLHDHSWQPEDKFLCLDNIVLH